MGRFPCPLPMRESRGGAECSREPLQDMLNQVARVNPAIGAYGA